MRRAVVLAVAVVVAVAVPTGGVLYVQDRREAERQRDRREASAAATGFLQAWAGRDYPAMDALTANAADAPGDVFERMDGRLKAMKVVATPGPLSVDGRTVPYDAVVTLAGAGVLRWSSTVELVETDAQGWRVAFRSSTVHQALVNGTRLDRKDLPSGRGQVLDRKGRPLSASADLTANVVGTPGKTGLQRVLDSRLAGTSGTRVVVVDVATEAEGRTVASYPAKPPEGVRTTLDLDVQRAAQQALSGLTARSALVAIDTATGEVRAIANNPTSGLSTALSSYAPGSVFKVVTATAALLDGATPTTALDCSQTYSSGGRSFRNDDGKALGRLDLRTAFAKSCNTAFLQLADDLPDGALDRAAALYGFDRPGELLPIDSDGGDVPDPASPAEAAADALGQGRVEASPLLLASMVAAVESGTWQQPRLLVGPGESRPLPPAVVAPMRQLMRAVVTGGTGTAAQGSGGAVSGKTGTAEFGTADPPRTHAWFAGYRGGLAFCVFVETGSSGGAVAAPVARQFLSSLPG